MQRACVVIVYLWKNVK